MAEKPETMDQRTRARKIYRITLAGGAINALLVALKFAAGIAGHSAAMVADAVHSLSDFVTDVIVLLFVRLSNRPSDRKYDYGYGKFETVATALIGLALLAVGIIILRDGAVRIVRAVRGDEPQAPSMIAFWMAIISIVSKEICYRFTIRVGREVDSQAVVANAWHHRSDAFSSVGTALGIGGAIMLGDKWRVLDPVAAAVVSLFIIRIAVDVLRESFGELTERSLPVETEEEIIRIASAVEGVGGIHNLRTRRIGNYCAIELHIRLDGSSTLDEAHDKATEIERLLRERFGERTFVGVHMEPAARRRHE